MYLLLCSRFFFRVKTGSLHKYDVICVNLYLKDNLLASGASESEIYIWDLNNPSNPMTPGQKSQVDVVLWCKQILTSAVSTQAEYTRCTSFVMFVLLFVNHIATRWRHVPGLEPSSAAHHGVDVRWALRGLGPAQKRAHHQNIGQHVPGTYAQRTSNLQWSVLQLVSLTLWNTVAVRLSACNHDRWCCGVCRSSASCCRGIPTSPRSCAWRQRTTTTP